jgi:hypothetical protein
LGAAKALNLYIIFEDKLKSECAEEKFSCSVEEYNEFVQDGHDILDTFLDATNLRKYFPLERYDFIGVEFPLNMELTNNVGFVAYVDLILKNKTTGKYKIFDFKTSTSGWNRYQIDDITKISQVYLYKAFYSKQYNVPLNDIEVEFFVLKRRLYEDVSYKQSRIQIVSPQGNNKSISECLGNFTKFIKDCFTETGEYNLAGPHYKIPGKAKKHCKYCIHHKVNCDGKTDLPETENFF